ncbi:MAG: heavy-metal-associated domain-containing protein [Gammaproteobacteria bacterium]|nr:heavy-metal-associated domain-containing protein [Gammaproteobacteria bacterium]
MQFDVENIKCGGCAGTIKKKLMEDQRISHVGVNIEQGVVIIDANINATEDWRSALLNMGYPEKGSAEGMAAAKARAKSFVSCAVGRVDQALGK